MLRSVILLGSVFTDCADTRAGDVVPRPLGETVHGTAPNKVVHFDYLHVGQNGPQAAQGLSEVAGFRYILVIIDDLSNYVCLEPVEVCAAQATAAALLSWCKTLGVPRVWVSETATHFNNAIFTLLREALSVEHQLAVAEAEDHSLIVLDDWVVVEVEERPWEPLKVIFEAAPKFLSKELRKLRVTRAVATRIARKFDIRL